MNSLSASEPLAVGSGLLAAPRAQPKVKLQEVAWITSQSPKEQGLLLKAQGFFNVFDIARCF